MLRLIDTSTKKPIDKKGLLELLKTHRVKTGSVEKPEIPQQDIIPTLWKAEGKHTCNVLQRLSLSKSGL